MKPITVQSRLSYIQPVHCKRGEEACSRLSAAFMLIAATHWWWRKNKPHDNVLHSRQPMYLRFSGRSSSSQGNSLKRPLNLREDVWPQLYRPSVSQIWPVVMASTSWKHQNLVWFRFSFRGHRVIPLSAVVQYDRPPTSRRRPIT